MDKASGELRPFTLEEREAVYRAIRLRRDVRHYVPGEVPDEVLERVLTAGHFAPSVGFSQPWRFLVIRSDEKRKRIKANFDRTSREQWERIEGTPEGDLYRELKLEAILDSSLNIAVACRKPARDEFILGQGMMPETLTYSVCMAIQNMWLAARAEGLGLCWVSILDPEAMRGELELPDDFELLAYLCVGYPQQFRQRPGLEEAGWKDRKPLSGVVFDEKWGEELDLSEQAPSPKREVEDYLVAAQEELDLKTKPKDSLGRLEEVAQRLASLQQNLKPEIHRRRVIVFAGNHGVIEERVSPYPGEVTGQMVLNFLGGGAAINVICRALGIELNVVDVGVGQDWPAESLKQPGFIVHPVRCGTRNFAKETAMTPDECEQALAIGREQVRTAKVDGVDVIGLGEMGIGNTTSSAALYGALLKLSGEEVCGRGTGADDSMLQRKVEVVNRSVELHRDACGEYAQAWLSAVGGFEIAAMTGAILEASGNRLPVVIDGFIGTVAALVASRMDAGALHVCFFSHCSKEAAHALVLERMGVSPLLDLDLRLGEGTGSALAIPFLEVSARILGEMSTFEEAGVTHRSKV